MLKAFHTPSRHAYLLIAALAISGCRLQPTLQKDSLQGTKPNILFVISDDQSYPYASAYGSKRSEEHTSELQSLMRISYDVFCLKKKNNNQNIKDCVPKSE